MQRVRTETRRFNAASILFKAEPVFKEYLPDYAHLESLTCEQPLTQHSLTSGEQKEKILRSQSLNIFSYIFKYLRYFRARAKERTLIFSQNRL
jgi:hypothetical protein